MSFSITGWRVAGEGSLAREVQFAAPLQDETNIIAEQVRAQVLALNSSPSSPRPQLFALKSMLVASQYSACHRNLMLSSIGSSLRRRRGSATWARPSSLSRPTHQHHNLAPRLPILLHSRHILVQPILTPFASPHPRLPQFHLGSEQLVWDRRRDNLVESSTKAFVANGFVGVLWRSRVLVASVAAAGLLSRGTSEGGADGFEVSEMVLLL